MQPLIPTPCTSHLLHSHSSNNRETHSAQRMLFLSERVIRRDTDFFEEAEIFLVTITIISEAHSSEQGFGDLPGVVHINLQQEPFFDINQIFPETFFTSTFGS